MLAPDASADEQRAFGSWPEGGAHTFANGQGACKPCHDAKTAGEVRRGYQR